MCRYEQYANSASEVMYVAEEHAMYGSSRIGLDNRRDTLYKAAAYAPAWYSNNKYHRALGAKSYKLSNHLGNVPVTVSDKKVYKTSSGNIYFEAEVSSITDYYPFGSVMSWQQTSGAMQGRSFSFTQYRYGFNNQEKEQELADGTTSAEFWQYDGRLGRRWNPDPKPIVSFSIYVCFNNNPILHVDFYGDSAWFYYQSSGAAYSEWHYHADVDDNLKLQTGVDESGGAVYTTVKGYKNLLIAQGNVNEPQAGQKMDKNMATYTFYAKDGTKIIVSGLTLASSDATKTSIDEGIYMIKREVPHKHFKWRVLNTNGQDNIRCRDGQLNKNSPSQTNTITVNGKTVVEGYKGGIYLHTAFSDNVVVAGASVGCQTIKSTDYVKLDNKMSAMIKVGESFTYILSRTGGVGNPELASVKEYFPDNKINLGIEPMPNDNIGTNAPNGLKPVILLKK